MAIVDAAVAAGTFLSAGALEGTGAAILGGAAIGAGTGALYSGITGDGNVLNSALNGALIGGGTMGIGAAAGLTGASGTLFGPAQTGLLSSLAPTGGAAVTGGLAPVTGVDLGANTLASSINAMPEGVVANAANSIPTVLPDVSSAAGQYAPEMMGEYGGPQIGSPEALASNVANVSTGGNAASSLFGDIPSWVKYGGAALGLGALMKKDNARYGTIANPASNPLPYKSNFGTYQPLDTTVMRPMGPAAGYSGTPYGAPGYVGSRIGYAAGGITNSDNGATPPNPPPGGPVEQMSRDNALGQNQMFPQANLQTNAFSSATNTPMGSNMIAAAGDTNVDPYTGAEKFAAGGAVPSLGGYAAGGNPRLLKGPGDGMSDNIPATIGGKQPARLADGEFVVPADVVSHLGNGSTDAGAKHLYNMMDKVRKARTGNKKQGKQIKADKFLPK